MSKQAQHLLIVDDDAEIRDLLGKFLTSHGYQVSLAANGVDMFSSLEKIHPDLVILDIMMPGEDGVSLCRKLRKSSTVPVLFLTAMAEVDERISGLKAGADDYLAKPANPSELLARVEAILRRSNPNKNGLYEGSVCFAGWRLDMSSRVLFNPNDEEVNLSSGEYELLQVFIDNPMQVMSREKLYMSTHKYPAENIDRAVDIQVSRLRQKIEENPKYPQLIKTVRGGGYILAAKVEQTK